LTADEFTNNCTYYREDDEYFLALRKSMAANGVAGLENVAVNLATSTEPSNLHVRLNQAIAVLIITRKSSIKKPIRTLGNRPKPNQTRNSGAMVTFGTAWEVTRRGTQRAQKAFTGGNDLA
jgi:hypothetical protein